MSTTLFIGPSVPPEQVRSVFGGEIRPPIKRGDLPELLARPEPPTHIGIVDGQFLHELSVTPKEVLRTLHAGVTVYGSSSMGVLRAVECAPYGMIGIGRIFEMYDTGEIDADDEVAITFDTETLAAMSEPLVNMRIAIQAAVRAGAVARQTADAALAEAKAMYFPDRTYRNLRRATESRLSVEDHRRLFAFLDAPGLPDQKCRDALELITAVNTAAAVGPASTSAAFDRIPDLGAGLLK